MSIQEELDYLNRHKHFLFSAEYLPNVKNLYGKYFPNGITLYDYLYHLALNNPRLFQLLDIYKNSPEEWSFIYRNLNKMDSGGFGHGGNVGKSYANMQRDPYYSYSRLYAWQSFLEIIKPSDGFKNHHLIIDLLAGNGTSARMIKKIIAADQLPYIVGVDISEVMVNDTLEHDELILRCSASDNLFKNNIADAILCAYGTHHIPVEEQINMVLSAKKLLKEGGIFILHDFDEETQTAKFYSEIIHKYRVGGHDFKHFNPQSIHQLLEKAFPDHSVKYIYEPFYLEYSSGQTDESIFKDFFIYLIELLSLEKIIPPEYDFQHLQDIDSELFWQEIKEELGTYFALTPEELEKCCNCVNPPVPVVNKLCIIQEKEVKKLVAPRISILGVGYKI